MRTRLGSPSPYSSPWSPSRSAQSAPQPARAPRSATPKRGGTITIARHEDSQSFDKTNVFQNESIWLAEQIIEPLYTVGNDGKTLKPWLATSYTKSERTARPTRSSCATACKFSNGKPMTSADVKFSIDDARAQNKGWGYLDAAIKNITAPNPSTVVFHLKYPWAPFLADIALFANGIIPKNFAGQTRDGVLQAPDRHRPVHVGQARRRPVGDVQAQPELLAEGQAVPRLASRGRT